MATVSDNQKLKDSEPLHFVEQYIFTFDKNFKIWESEVFPLKEGLWKIVVSPHETSLGIYLECVSNRGEMENWSCIVNGLIRLKKHIQCYNTAYHQEPYFTFNYSSVEKTKKIGYDTFIKLQDLYCQENGWLNNGNITLEVSLIADFDKSKLCDTHYVGIKNQGATCYMNSVLQILFFTNILRRAVYQIPAESNNDMMAFCLQRIFFDMQFGGHSVNIKDFTFLCTGMSPHSQEDATETLTNLLNKLDKIMNNSGLIASLFKGKTNYIIKCTDTNYTSTKEVPFCGLPLNIKGLKDIDASIKEYIRSDLLDGDNKYNTGEHGLQTAYRDVNFTDIPPILHFYLKRFQYDLQKQTPFKYNGRFEFSASINLDKYLENKKLGEYLLHAVLIHCGEINSGHYVVFINPKLNGSWYKFDDNRVTKCSDKEAIHQNFGGSTNSEGYRSNSSAYMLVYIRKSEMGRILMKIPQDQIGLSLATRFKLEQGFDDFELKLQHKKKMSIRKSLKYNVYVPPPPNKCNAENKIVNKIVNRFSNLTTTESNMRLAKTIAQLFDSKRNVNDAANTLSKTFKFNIFWISNDLKVERDLSIVLGVNDSVKVLLKIANKCVSVSENTNAAVRLLKIENHQIVEICKENTLIKSLIHSEKPFTTTSIDSQIAMPTYRIEEIPADHQYLTIFELLLPVFHFKQNIFNTFGVPFLIRVRNGELYCNVKKRIQNRLNITNEEWKKLYLCLVIKKKCIHIKGKSKVTHSIFKNAFEGKSLPSFGLKHSSE